MLLTDNSYRTCLTASVTTRLQLTHHLLASHHHRLKPDHQRHFLRANLATIYPLAWSDLNRSFHKVQRWRRWSLVSQIAKQMAHNKRSCIITSTSHRLKCLRYVFASIRPLASTQHHHHNHRTMSSLLLLQAEVQLELHNFLRHMRCLMGVIWQECHKWVIFIDLLSRRHQSLKRLRDCCKK